MASRILTGLALLPIVGVLYFAPPLGFLALALLAALLTGTELVTILAAGGKKPLRLASLAGVVLLTLAAFMPERLPLELAFAVGASLLFGACFLRETDVTRSLDALGASLLVLLVPGFLLSFQVSLRLVDRHDPDLHPPALLLFLYAAVFGNDTIAYFVGRAVGRVQLAPRVSPKKTVEGLLGGIAGGTVLALCFDAVLPTGLPLGRAAGFAFLCASAAVFGDLSVSLLKRSARVKDTGALLPGHGGLLDRLDGLLFASPLLYLACTRGELP